MSLQTVNLTLQEDILRAALQTLMTDGDVIPKRKYRITDAIGPSAEVIIVTGETVNTISGYAINETTDEYGTYNIGTDVFTTQGGGSGVQTVTGDSVDNSDLLNPVVNAIPYDAADQTTDITGSFYIDDATGKGEVCDDGTVSTFIKHLKNAWSVFSGSFSSAFMSIISVQPNTISISSKDNTSGYEAIITLSPTQAEIANNDPAFPGFQYDADYSPNFTDRTLVDKGFVLNRILYGRVAGTFVLTSTTAAQKLLDISTNGAIAVEAATLYDFECNFELTGLAASGTVSFGIGGTATITSIKMTSFGVKAASLALQAAGIATSYTSTIVMTASNANTTVQALVRGRIFINAAGTIIPQVILGTGAAATVGAGAYFKLEKLGTTNTRGTWS